MSIGYVYAIIIVVALLWLFILGQASKDKSNFAAFWHAHGLFLNPLKWVFALTMYKTDQDVKTFVVRRFIFICTVSHLLPFFLWLFSNYGWKTDFAESNQLIAFVAGLNFKSLFWLGLASGTLFSNLYAAKRFKLIPTDEVIAWGKLYGKDKHLSRLKKKIVEKFWYGALIKVALSRKVGDGQNQYNFKLARKPDGSVDVDASLLPVCTGGPKSNVVINTSGFLFSHENFVRILPELESFTGLRTISIAKSGHNSIINLECSHKDLPSGLIPFNQVPRPTDMRQINFGFTGKNWVGVKLGKDKHLLVAGNTGAGKSVIFEDLIAAAPANCIFVVIDFLKDAIDFQACKYDPYKLAVLKQQRAKNGMSAAEFRERCWKFDPIPMLTVADSKARAVLAFRWVYGELLSRLDILGLHVESSIEALSDKEVMHDPERFPWIVVMLDEAAAMTFASANDPQISEIKRVIDRLTVLGRAMGIMMVQATQIPSAKAVGSDNAMSTRGNYQWIVLNMSARHIKMLTEMQFDVPGGNEQEFVGTFAKEHGNGHLFAKAAFIKQDEMARIAWVRGNLSEDDPKRKAFVMSRLENLVKEGTISSSFAQGMIEDAGPSELGIEEWAELNELVKSGVADRALRVDEVME